MTEVPVDFNVMARDGCGPRSMSRLTRAAFDESLDNGHLPPEMVEGQI